MNFDLNADLGEGEPSRRTRALMRRVTSCNIACGVHAGSVESMRRCVELALEFWVRIGAHPGVPGEFGRGAVTWSVAEFEQQLMRQVGSLASIVAARRTDLHHVKLHGALYHHVERHADFAAAFLQTMSREFPGVRVYALAGGRLASAARECGVEVWEEGFLDRGYRVDGSLIPRGQPGAMLEGADELRRRIHGLREFGGIALPGGAVVQVRTLCLHGDAPDSVRTADRAARWLGSALDRK